MTNITANELSLAHDELNQARKHLYSSAQQAVSADYTLSDLMRAGLSRRVAQGYLAKRVAAEEVVLTGSYEPELKPYEMDVVSIVAAAEAIEDFDEHGFYARSCELSLPVPQEATWLTYARSRQIDMIRPILARFYVPNPDAPMNVEDTYAADAARIIASDRYASRFTGPSALFILGDEVALDRPIPLGYPAVLGTRSYYYCDLRKAEVLKGTPTISQ